MARDTWPVLWDVDGTESATGFGSRSLPPRMTMVAHGGDGTTADEVVLDVVEHEVQRYRAAKDIKAVWKTHGRLLCCIGPGPGAEHVVRSAARLANQLGEEWTAVYVETPALQRLPNEERASWSRPRGRGRADELRLLQVQRRAVLRRQQHARDVRLARDVARRVAPQIFRPRSSWPFSITPRHS